jgi:hypothetical protein
MRRFWETLDTQLLRFAGMFVFWAVYVAIAGEYPQGKSLRPPMKGGASDVWLLSGCSFGLAGLSFLVRGIKKKKPISRK